MATRSSAFDSAARREREGVLMCVATAASFAAMVVFAKLAYAAGANVTTLLAPRFAIAAVVLWLLAARRGVARNVTRRDALAALALGFVVYAGETELMFQALARLEASLAELIVFVYPALVVLGAIALRREAASRRRLVALALAMTGVTLVLGGAASAPGGAGLALLLPLGAALMFTGYVLTAERINGRIHPLTFGALICTGAAISFSGGGVLSGSLQLGMPLPAWGWTVAIALGSTVVPISAFLGGVARLGPGRASILAMLEPPLALLAAFVVFGDRLGVVQLVGGALVLLAAVMLQMRPVRSRDRGAPAGTAHHPPARPLTDLPAAGAGLGVRAEVGRLSRARVRRREHDRPPVAQR
jgi:drug/metabolite transporter (DMT)-like permease